jgi:uncharacterized membrane protein YphA (DoxX/SURF4 family)
MAGVSKLSDWNAIRELIQNYSIVPASSIRMFVWAITLIELWIGFSLIAGFYVKMHSLCAIGLLSVFSIVVAAVSAQGATIYCGCFELIYQSKTDLAAIARNFVFSAVGLAVLFRPSDPFSLDALKRCR